MSSILLALLGTTIASIGSVFQKKGIEWLNYRKEKKTGLFPLFFLWLFGILLSYIISAIPISFASKTLPPHIITAMSGWGIVVIVIMSYFFLKEHIQKSDIFYSAIIVGCTLAIGLSTKPTQVFDANITFIVILFAAPFVILIPAFSKSIEKKIKAAIFAAFAGCMGGVSIVFFNLLTRHFFSKGLEGIPLYFFILYPISALAGAVFEQNSYRLGDMSLVTSIRMGLFIIYPVICSVLLFNSILSITQIISGLVMIWACYGIFSKR